MLAHLCVNTAAKRLINMVGYQLYLDEYC